MYDYREAMTEDVKEWIKENIDLTERTEDREGLEQQSGALVYNAAVGGHKPV